MSLYVYVTRKPLPLEDDGLSISDAEWREVALRDPNFRNPSGIDDETDGLIWAPPGEGGASFTWSHGQVEVKNASAQIVARMQRLASEIGARVVSETGERFDQDGKHAGFEAWSEFYEAPRPSLLSRLLGKA